MRSALTIIAAICGLATIAYAAIDPVEIRQAGKKFSERRVTVKVGESLACVNDDETTHNVYSNSDGNQFDLGAQAPGTTAMHIFDHVGKAKVRCAIHPKMKIDVTVVE